MMQLNVLYMYIMQQCSDETVHFLPFSCGLVCLFSLHIIAGPTEEEERLTEKVKKLQSELSKAKKDAESHKSADGMITIHHFVI